MFACACTNPLGATLPSRFVKLSTFLVGFPMCHTLAKAAPRTKCYKILCSGSLWRSASLFLLLQCLKKSEVLRMKQVEHILAEASILGSIRHPFIVNMLKTFQVCFHDDVSLQRCALWGHVALFARQHGALRCMQ